MREATRNLNEGYIKLKVTVKTFTLIQKITILNKHCYLKLSNSLVNPEKKKKKRMASKKGWLPQKYYTNNDFRKTM